MELEQNPQIKMLIIRRRAPWNFILILCFLASALTFFNGSLQDKCSCSDGSDGETLLISNWKHQLTYQSTLPPIAGYRTPHKKFLVIGISTVYRTKNYLRKTLNSLIRESTLRERMDAVVVIYLADIQADRKEMQLNLIRENFQIYLDSGFIQVIESSPSIYPPMDFALTKRTFNDSVERVIWRTKQVIDYAFLFSYAKNISDYYLVGEDDIITSNQYISAIRDYVNMKKDQRWVALEFTEFLGIGLLFRTRDLPKMIDLLIMFHQNQPVDMLMRQFINLQVPESAYSRRIPSIFQHIGRSSTLPNKTLKIIDSTFGPARRLFRHQNPPAELSSSMQIHKEFFPDYPYKPTPGYFWGIPSSHEDTFDIMFKNHLNISRIVIFTGLPISKDNGTPAPGINLKDYLTSGVLQSSDNCLRLGKDGLVYAKEFQYIAVFRNGMLDINRYLRDVKCLRIKIGKGQKTWVVIREIEIFQSNMTSYVKR